MTVHILHQRKGINPLRRKGEPGQQPDALQAKRILFLQLALTLTLATVALLFGIPVALSVLIGASVCMAANSVFAFWVFWYYQAQDPKSILVRFYGAELIKLFLALGLFVIAFMASEGLNVPSMLVAYFAVQVLPAVLAPGRGGGARKIPER